jgi:predicted O-methyltransferase YrrM
MSFGKDVLKRTLKTFGLVPLKTYRGQQDELSKWKKTIWEPGHYYSPQPDLTSIPAKADINSDEPLPGIDLNEQFQLTLLNELSLLYTAELFPDKQADGSRYYFENDYFGYSDGIFLNTMIRHFKPERIIEVGSGFSSALMLDTNERFFDGRIKLQFIEPFPEERLFHLIKENDNCVVVRDLVQNTGDDIWDSLERNDVLFIDSSHVSKYRSDVNYLFFKVIPKLKPGVIIHIHDVFFPFDYPVEWLKQGRAWNEAYLLRAFLQFNSDFEIILFSSYLEQKHESWFHKNMPACLVEHKTIEINGNVQRMPGRGQSIYIRRKG